MKHLFLFTTFLFLANTTFAQQTFDAKGNSSINVNIANNGFAVQQTREAKVQIELEIKVNYNKDVIDHLVKIGRYNVTATASNGQYTLAAPILAQKVTVGGKTLTEDIKINVKTPSTFSSRGTTILKGAEAKGISEPVTVALRFVYPKVAPSSGNTTETMGAMPERTNEDPKTPKGVQSMYGDIIMGGMPLDNFYD